MSSSGAALIAAERRRQIEAEGYTTEWDLALPVDVLARAGACYAMPSEYRLIDPRTDLPFAWPFGDRAWKPSDGDRIRELVKAGALIAAELDHLLVKDVTPSR